MPDDLDEDVISMIVEEVEEWLAEDYVSEKPKAKQDVIDEAIDQLTRDFRFDICHQEEVAEARRRLNAL